MKSWHVKGDQKLDDMADTAADMHRTPQDKALPLFNTFENLNLVLDRFIAVSMFPQRQHNKTVM